MVKLDADEKNIYEVPFDKSIILDGKKINISRLILTNKYIRIQYYTHIYLNKLKKVYEQIYINLESILLKDSYPEIFFTEKKKKIILSVYFDDDKLDIEIKYKKRKCISEVKTFIKKTCELIEEKVDKKISKIEPEINEVKLEKIRAFLLSLGESKTELNNKNLKRIKTLYPLPKEHNVIWADCTFEKKCLGVIFTQKGIFIKKELNKENFETILKYFKWEYVDESFFDMHFENMNFYEIEFPLSYKCNKVGELSNNINENTNYFIYDNLLNEGILEDYKFILKHKNQSTKHGFYAEKANNISDIYNGKRVPKNLDGDNNKLNGNDRRIKKNFGKDILIQTKYCKTASKSVAAAFGKDGTYRYGDMKLEVPYDQYEEALKLFEKRIKKGKVYTSNGKLVTDPSKAKDYVIQGSYTYNQTVAMAKAGNLDSLKYDTMNGTVICKSVFTISFLCNVATSFRYNTDLHQVVKTSLVNAGQIYVSSLAKYVIIQQIARTSLMKHLDNIFVPNIGKNNTLTILDYPLTVITLSIPSIVSAFQRNISYGQLMKNIVVLSGSVAGGLVGAKIGWHIGFKVLWFFGAPIGSLIGGLIGQKKGLELSKKKADELREDDIVIFSYIYYSYIEALSIDYMLDENEIIKLAKILSDVKPEDLLLLNRKFIKNDYSEEIIIKFLDKKIKRVINDRPKLNDNKIIDAMFFISNTQG